MTFPLNIGVTWGMTCNIAQKRSLQYQQLFNQRHNSREYSLLPQLRAYFAFPICCNWSSVFKRSELLLFPFFQVKCNVPSSLLQKTYSWKQSFFRNLPKGYNIDGKQFNKISRQKLPLSWYLFVAPFTSIEYILVSKVLKNNFAAFQKKNKFKLASFFGENLWLNFNFFQWNLLSKGN